MRRGNLYSVDMRSIELVPPADAPCRYYGSLGGLQEAPFLQRIPPGLPRDTMRK